MSKEKKTLITLVALAGIVVGICLSGGAGALLHKTSSNEYCMKCHYHTDADVAWKQSYHYNNGSGTKTDCIDCHLPESGTCRYYKAKVLTGAKDILSYWTKDKEEIDWESKKELEYASKIVYNESCKRCHVNLYPQGINDDGITAHLYYDENEEKLDLQCISCHLDAGHYNPNYSHSQMAGVPKSASANTEIYLNATEVTEFKDFVETIPGTTASLSMKAIPAGSFTMGSPENEAFRKADEGPQRNVNVSAFFMGEIEVTWDQYWAFYGETMSEGRTPPETIYANNSRKDIDAVSGPTPPFGAPDQGWGLGDHPAITMTHYAAETFCQWLSLKTGKTYRLPTEAEWEYAARGGTSTPYYFEGDPKKFSEKGFLRSIFKADTTGIASNIIYAANSKNRAQDPSKVAANPFGLKNMLGNVMEYCSDYYAEDAYSHMEDGCTDPKGPQTGTEFVVRGGQYSDGPEDTRCASRAATCYDDWLKTDPQNPKSIWWFSDIKGIGFRVVCELPENIK